MFDRLGNIVSLSDSEKASGIQGIGLLNLSYKSLPIGKELAQHLLTQLRPHLKFAYAMRARLIKPHIEDARYYKRIRAEACSELAKIGMSDTSCIVEFYTQQVQASLATINLLKRSTLFAVRNLQATCKQILAQPESQIVSDSALAFQLGQQCAHIENSRFVYFHEEHKLKSKAKYGRDKMIKSQWQAEIGWRLYFDYWIHGKSLLREKVEKKYSSLLPTTYLTKMSNKTLSVAMAQQQKFYHSIDKRVPKPAGAGRKPQRN